MSDPRPPDVLARAWALGLDVALAEVHRALQAAGVRAILLKGPAIAAWLYDDSERVYTDIDLLVSQDGGAAAAAALVALGFTRPYADVGAAATPEHHAQIWRRGHPRVAEVDLHHRFAGVSADPAVMWNALAGRTVALTVAGREIETLDHVGLALIIALHAAAHGPEDEWPREDLARALQRASAQTWSGAADLARHLAAEQSFALGLRRLPAGVLLAERLELTTQISTHAALLSSGVSHGPWGFQQFAAAAGWRARVALLREKLLPSRAFMGHWAPWTRRGRVALALGYAWRLLWLIVAAPRGAQRYHAARAQANAGPSARRQPGPTQDVHVALWALRCVRLARRQLTTAGLNGPLLPTPPAAGRERVVSVVLKLLGTSCLVESVVRQAWLAARGDERDLIIGVANSSEDFRAHAWLDGDPERGRAGFAELARKPPPRRYS